MDIEDAHSTVQGLDSPDEFRRSSATSCSSNSNSEQGSGSLKRLASTPSRRYVSARLEALFFSEEEDALPDELITSVSRSLSFCGAEDLARAVPLSRVMRGCGRIFSRSADAMVTYNASTAVQRIRVFISHNWSVARIDKFLALSLKYNFSLAFMTFVLLLLLLSIVSLTGHNPEIGADISWIGPDRAGCLARIIIAPVVLFVFIFGRDICTAFGWKGPSAFLDKACIHQEDQELKVQAINKLGAFLRISDHMLVLYGNEYCRKLWTVYEVANFLTTNDIKNLDVVPVLLPRVFFSAMLVFFINGAMTMVLRSCCHFRAGIYIFSCTLCLVYLRTCSRWARHKVETQNLLTNFEVRECTCAVEEDRPMIYAKIADLMRISRRVERNACLDEALTAFNETVRQKLPQAFKVIFGWSMLSYEQYVFVSLILVAPNAVDSLTQIDSDFSNQVINSVLRDIMWGFSIYPFVLWFMEVCVARWQHWTGCWEWILHVVILLFAATFAVAVSDSTTLLWSRSSTDSPWITLAIAVTVILGTFTTVLLTRRRSAARSASFPQQLQQQQQQQSRQQQQQQQQQQDDPAQEQQSKQNGKERQRAESNCSTNTPAPDSTASSKEDFNDDCLPAEEGSSPDWSCDLTFGEEFLDHCDV